MTISNLVSVAATAGLLAAGFAVDPVHADAPPAAIHTAASWQKHEYEFAFMGFTTTYSCDGLADKLRVLLIAAGARSDAKSRPGACASSFGRPDKFARASLTFYTLAPNAPEDGSPPVDGIWKPVNFAYHQPRELERGDCELIEQFKSSVLPMFTTRNLDNKTTCVPHQDSGSLIDLKFESLAAPAKAVKPGTRTQPAPIS